MPRVTATELPAHSRLWARKAPDDFLDCYSVAAGLAPRRAAEVITDFPGWARLLLRLRGGGVVPVSATTASTNPPGTEREPPRR